MRLAADAADVEIPDYARELNDIVLTSTDEMLDPDQKQAHAQSMLFDNQYQMIKDAVERDIASCIDELINSREQDEHTASERLSFLLVLQGLFTVLLVVAVLAVIGTVVALVLKPIAAYTAHLKTGEPLDEKGSQELRFLARTYNELLGKTKEYEAVLRHQARHDPLTDLYNRNSYDVFHHETDTQRAMLLVDIDFFKHVNDTLGHDMGDKVLCKMADALRSCFREEDKVYRIGGDEFSVIMEGAGPADRPDIEARIRQLGQIMERGDDGLPPVTVSAGVAFTDDLTDDGIGFYKAADIALYGVKEAGRDGFAFYRDVKQKRQQGERE
jgi:diguanylate cyclase (GGDEF)-like protein